MRYSPLKPKQIPNFTNQSLLSLGKPLYIQDVSEETMEGTNQNTQVTGLDKYGYRLLSLVTDQPGLWLYNQEDSEYMTQYLEYLETVTQTKNKIQTLGLQMQNQSLTQAAIENFEKIEEFGCESLIPFIMSESSERIADLLNLACFERHQSSEKLNNKGIFLETCKIKGVPTPYGSSFSNPQEAWSLFNELKSRGAIAFYSKLSRSASGQGIRQFSYQDPNLEENFKSYLTSQDTISNMEQFGIRMDEAIIFEDSPAIVFWMCPFNGLQLVNSNYQVLNKRNEEDLNPTVHKGSQGPIEQSQMNSLSFTIQKIEEILKENHCYGPGSIDLISRTNPLTHSREEFVVEINKRITGGYHNFLAQKFGFNYFRSDCNLSCSSSVSFQDLLQTLEENQLLWTQGKNSGTFIVNYQTAPMHEKIAVISFGQSQQEAQSVYTSTKELINKL